MEEDLGGDASTLRVDDGKLPFLESWACWHISPPRLAGCLLLP